MFIFWKIAQTKYFHYSSRQKRKIKGCYGFASMVELEGGRGERCFGRPFAAKARIESNTFLPLKELNSTDFYTRKCPERDTQAVKYFIDEG